MTNEYKPIIPKYARFASAYNDERTVLISFSAGVYTDPFEEIALSEETVHELKMQLDEIIESWKEADKIEKTILDYGKDEIAMLLNLCDHLSTANPENKKL